MFNNRALFAIVMVNFVSIAGFGFLFPVFAIYADQIGASGTDIGWAIAGFSIGQFISGPLWGRASDKYGRRPILIVSLIVGAIVTALTAFAVTPSLLIFARFLAGVATGSFAVAFAVAADISTKETRTKIMGIVGAGFSLGFIFGPAIGGLTAGSDPGPDSFARVCYVGAGLTFFAALVTYVFLPETRPVNTQTREKDSQAKGENTYITLLKTSGFLAPVLIGLFITMSFAAMEAIFPLFADKALGLNPVNIGFIFASMGVIGAIFQASLSGIIAKHFGEHLMLLGAIAFLAMGLYLIGAGGGLIMVLIGVLIQAMGYSLLTPAINSLASMSAPATEQGAALGFLQGAQSLGRIIGPLAAGVLYDLRGPSAPFTWSAYLALLVLVFAGLWYWKTKNTRQEFAP